MKFYQHQEFSFEEKVLFDQMIHSIPESVINFNMDTRFFEYLNTIDCEINFMNRLKSLDIIFDTD